MYQGDRTDIFSFTPDMALIGLAPRRPQTIQNWRLLDQNEVRRQAQERYTRLVETRRQQF